MYIYIYISPKPSRSSSEKSQNSLQLQRLAAGVTHRRVIRWHVTILGSYQLHANFPYETLPWRQILSGRVLKPW